jgi:hypothetical protein
MNQGFNPSVPLDMAAQQYRWSPGDALYSSLNSLGVRPHSSSLLGHDQQNQYFNTAGSNQNTVPLCEARLMGVG